MVIPLRALILDLSKNQKQNGGRHEVKKCYIPEYYNTLKDSLFKNYSEKMMINIQLYSLPQ